MAGAFDPNVFWSGAFYTEGEGEDAPPATTDWTKAVPGAELELHARNAGAGGIPAVNSPFDTTWRDRSGYGNHGTLEYFAGTTASGWDTAPYRLVFDGTDDYVQVPGAGFAPGSFS